jgi:hypothetical protein
VYQGVERFYSDTTSVVDEDRSGLPTTSGMTDNVERFNALIQEDKRITVTDVTNILDIGYGSRVSEKLYKVGAKAAHR